MALRVSTLLVLVGAFTAMFWQVATNGPLTNADNWVLAAVSGGINPALFEVGQVLSFIGSPMAAGLTGIASLIGLGALQRWRAMTALLVAVAGAGATVALCKIIVDRPRPEADIDLVEAGSSFPSASSVLAAAVFGAYAVIILPRLFPAHTLRTIRAALFALPVAVGCGRILVSAHFATDVIAGLCVGAFWVIAADALVPERR